MHYILNLVRKIYFIPCIKRKQTYTTIPVHQVKHLQYNFKVPPSQCFSHCNHKHEKCKSCGYGLQRYCTTDKVAVDKLKLFTSMN